MVHLFFKTLSLRKRNYLGIVALMLAMFAAGTGLMCLICTVESQEPLSEDSFYTSMGTMMAVLGLLAYSVFGFLTYTHEFNLALTMGRTRKEFLVFYALERLIMSVLLLGVSFLLSPIETALYKVLYPTWYLDNFLMTWLLDWRVLLALIAVMVLLPMFFGSMYSRFGKTFYVIVYAIWIIACIGLPRLAAHFDEPDSALSPVLGQLAAIPPVVWGILAGAAAVAMTAAIIIQGKKHMVH